LVQLREPDMPTIGQTKKDPPLDELVDRLTELVKQLPGLDLPTSTPLSPAPAEGDTDDKALTPVDQSAKRELLENLMETLKRVEAVQAHTVADLRREIAQTFGQLALAHERAELSDISIQKLQVALGVAARESTERRILSELALLRADLQPRSEEPPETQKGIGGRIVALGLGIILVVVGVVAGTLAASSIAPWLHWALGLG
jgi:hypothetical protein